MSGIARMRSSSSKQQSREASRRTQRTSSPLCTRPFGHSVVRRRPSVASASAQPTWRPARVCHVLEHRYRANTAMYHNPPPHSLTPPPSPSLPLPLSLSLSLSPCVSRSRFYQIGELKWFPHTSDRGYAASCSRSEPEPPCRPIPCLKGQGRWRMRDTFLGLWGLVYSHPAGVPGPRLASRL
ncbi:hypothetical protein LZ31DRAFT_83335 [Colletotrichum somersetense]|nr:hypothetical protein LZ31DRAFT_83335 [Colletotrichum somersetense]